MKLSLIVAMSNNGVIGIDNTLPWHLPEDLKYFKQVTMGKPIIMGRKTYDSIGRPLPGRLNIVITRDDRWTAEGVSVVHSLEQALALAAQQPGDEAMVIGGEQIYRLALPMAQRLYLTRVDADIDGDAFFPSIDERQWVQVQELIAEPVGDLHYRFVTLQRS